MKPPSDACSTIFARATSGEPDLAADVPFAGNPLAVHARLRKPRAPAMAALSGFKDQAIASHSPELLRCAPARSWKAPDERTAAQAVDADADRQAAAELAGDPKQRAENLMIVDLIRNDLSRVAVPSLVAVPDLFRVESFPTIHQLVSDVSARLPEGAGPSMYCARPFPAGRSRARPRCGAMEIIDEMEGMRAESIRDRSVYLGSGRGRCIQCCDPHPGSFRLSFQRPTACRTGVKSGHARSGIGNSCRQRGRMARMSGQGGICERSGRKFRPSGNDVFDPVEGVQRLEGHLARMKGSAEALGFTLDRHGARNSLQSATFRLRSRAGTDAAGAVGRAGGGGARLPNCPCRSPCARCRWRFDDFASNTRRACAPVGDLARRESGAAGGGFRRRAGFRHRGSLSSCAVERDGQLPDLSGGAGSASRCAARGTDRQRACGGIASAACRSGGRVLIGNSSAAWCRRGSWTVRHLRGFGVLAELRAA